MRAMRLNELLDVVFRWAHLIAGIMWIGNSMLFNWLDRNLIKPPPGPEHRLSQGKIYMVHSGAFYEVEKKLLEPGQLPDQLHWFKWQNFATWATGISLLVIVYFSNNAAYLVDTTRPWGQDFAPATAIQLSILSLVVGWIVYDLIWATLGKRAELVAHALTFVLVVGAAWCFTQMFSGRAAYIMTGVLIGTLMTGNVWLRILPSQKELIAATRSGREQDVSLSIRAKQRSIHNNYFTFPLLFIMISNHFPGTYGHELRFFVLFAVMIGGAGVRHFMNVRYAGRTWLLPALAMAAIGIVGMMALTSIKKERVVEKGRVDFADAQQIIVARCVPCHSSHPTDDQFKQAPNDVRFDHPEEIVRMAPRIMERAVDTKTMPFMNKTKMTDEERAKLAGWIVQGAKVYQ
jgi:uncharacterized membrane protein